MYGITLTFGECAENHVGMERIGKISDGGFSIEELMAASVKFNNEGFKCELIKLHDPNVCGLEEKLEEACVLVIRNGVSCFCKTDELLAEQSSLEPDKKAFMRGRVVNKRARYNLCFDDKDRDPNYEHGMGTIVSFDRVKNTNLIRNKLRDYFGNKATNLKCEGNYYYDLSKCYIGFHGDTERKLVIGVRLGEFPLYYRWYRNSDPHGKTIKVDLNHGDIYVMSEKAVGTDWKRRKIFTLRHAAGNLSLYSK